MATRRALTWIAAAAVVAAAVALWSHGDRMHSTGPMPAQAEFAEPSVPDPTRAPRTVVARDVDVAPTDETSAREGEAESDEAAGHGSLVGYLFDSEGSVRGGDVIGLAPSPPDPLVPPRAVRSATTDGEGYFEFQELAAGAWDVYWEGSRSGRGMASALLGTVEVRDGATARRDFVLPGMRSLSGVYLFAEDPDAVLWLELRYANASDQVAARGTTRTALAGRRESEADSGERESDDLGEDDAERPRRPEPAPGSFRFEHLSAEAYVLRIQLGTDPEGRPLFVEREVDLTLGDLELEAEHIEGSEFLLASMERRGDL